MATLFEENSELDMSLDLICVATGRKLTEEQKRFAMDFTKPRISFSDAGTGKTYATAVGIVNAQTYHRIPGKRICVVSFTRESAREISQRYDLMTRYVQVSSDAQFSTFHALCRAILLESWGECRPKSSHDYWTEIPELRSICEGLGLTDISDMWLRKLLSTIDNMNANFIFDSNALRKMYQFKELKIEPAIFNQIRVRWFAGQSMAHNITQGDIPLHAYFALRRKENVRKKFRKMFDILVIDEFQDMSVLYLKIVFELAKSVVVIGDMKQQIYAFNGACDKITEEYMRMFPEAEICPLTQSFRCKDAILDAAMKCEAPNRPPILEYSGMGEGGRVFTQSTRMFDIDSLINDIHTMQNNRETVTQRDIMFLSRNNLSTLSLIEKLYQAGVEFRTTKFKRVMDIPIFKEICILLDAITNDRDLEKVYAALKLMPEFRYTNSMEKTPLIQAIKASKRGWLNTNYRYKTAGMEQWVELFKTIREAIRKNTKKCGQIFNTLIPFYEQVIIEGNWWRLEFTKEFYCTLVAPIVNNKSYSIMVAEENDKMNRNEHNMQTFNGVRCYTIHSSKGLEADEVYIMDCDDGIVPSQKNYDSYIKRKCYNEAAIMIRNERNLLYVAITRARNLVGILYNTDLSVLVSSPDENKFSFLTDIYYGEQEEVFNDEAFMSLFNYTSQE